MAQPFKFGLHLAKVVYLSVENNHVPLRSRQHRLSAAWGEIDDRQPAKAECEAWRSIRPFARIVRSTMGQRISHRANGREEVDLGGFFRQPKTGNAAHSLRSQPQAFSLCSVCCGSLTMQLDPRTKQDQRATSDMDSASGTTFPDWPPPKRVR